MKLRKAEAGGGRRGAGRQGRDLFAIVIIGNGKVRYNEHVLWTCTLLFSDE